MKSEQKGIGVMLATQPVPHLGDPDLPTGLTCELEPLQMWGQARSSPHNHSWMGMIIKETTGLQAPGTFVPVVDGIIGAGGQA